MSSGSLLFPKMTSPTRSEDRSPSRSPKSVKTRHSPYVKTDIKRSSTLIGCPYDDQCESTALDFAGLISHAVYAHGVSNTFLCPFCPFSIPEPEALVHHGIMKHGFYPRNFPSCIGIPFMSTTRSTSTAHRTRRLLDHSEYLDDTVTPINLSSGASPQSWRPSLAYAADQQRYRNLHSRTSHRQPNSHPNARRRRSLSKDSNNTTPSPSPSPLRSPLNLNRHHDRTPPIDYTTAALYGPLLVPSLEPQPYPMPDYAEDTVIYPLEMPEFDDDDDIFGQSSANERKLL